MTHDSSRATTTLTTATATDHPSCFRKLANTSDSSMVDHARHLPPWGDGAAARDTSGRLTAPGRVIGWGEGGGQPEGWYPWWSGTIRVR